MEAGIGSVLPGRPAECGSCHCLGSGAAISENIFCVRIFCLENKVKPSFYTVQTLEAKVDKIQLADGS